MTKLHLGCGKRRIAGWFNVDIDPRCEPDVAADVFKLIRSCEQMPAINNVDIIYACHVLEHAGRHEYKAVLRRWLEVLKPGGTLRLSVPDFAAVVRQYVDPQVGEEVLFDEWNQRHGDINKLLAFLYGGQRNQYDYHKMGWDEASLSRDLLEAGFKDVGRWDWRTTEHAAVDDYSQAYLPHLSACKDRREYEQGRLMSLNLECIK